MSQVGLASSNSRLRLRLYPGVLTVVWPPSSVDDDNSYHAFALIIAMRFVDSGCLWFTVPLKTPSSPVSIDVASMYRTVTVSDPCVITAQLCGFMPGTPKGLIVVETATNMADGGSDADEGDVEDLLCRRLNLNFPSGLSSTCRWQVPTVSVKSLSAVQVVIQWKNTRLDYVPEKWMITLTRDVDKRRKQKASELATAYFYTLDGRTSKQKLPVRLAPCTEYTVTIAPLFKPSFCSFEIPSHWTCGERTTTFTTPAAELTVSDLQELHRAAVSYCSQSTSMECNWLYRNRSEQYFDNILKKCGGIMKIYRKDNSGDPASPINGNIDGLFFMAKNKNGIPPRYSYFGPIRLQVPSWVLLQMAPNLYFADFYCMRGSVHQVTLVMTKPGSISDEFCREKELPQLSLTDRQNNPFLFQSGGRLFTNNKKKLEVELLYTEDINVVKLQSQHNAVLSRTETKGRGHSKPDGIPKNPNCKICNVPVAMLNSNLQWATF